MTPPRDASPPPLLVLDEPVFPMEGMAEPSIRPRKGSQHIPVSWPQWSSPVGRTMPQQDTEGEEGKAWGGGHWEGWGLWGRENKGTQVEEAGEEANRAVTAREPD